MTIAFEKLQGLDRSRVIAAVEPILAAHGVDAVELVWRTDRGGWVLELTVERPGTRTPGEGITVDLCSEISRDVGNALDLADVMPSRYRLEVGSPGLERRLYSASDFERFSGQGVRIKLHEPLNGTSVFRGVLRGVSGRKSAQEDLGGEGAVGGLAASRDEASSAEDPQTLPRKEEAVQELVLVEVGGLEHSVALSSISEAQLVFDWQRGNESPKGRRSPSAARKPQRSR